VILAVTHGGDDHAPLVQGALARLGAEVFALDLADLPGRGSLALAYEWPGREGGSFVLQLEGRPPLDLGKVTAVWWRRPRLMEAAPGLSAERASFAVRQAGDALMGAVASLAPHALLVNDPWREARASLKTLQLAAARRLGFRIPETLVTNDPATASAFLSPRGEGGAVHKAVHATPADWRKTARVGPRFRSRLEDLRAAPVILQERVPGVDVRVTVVGEALFAAEIDARGSSSPDDFRGVEDECRFAPRELPPDEAARLQALTQELGLSFAAVDYRRRDDGAWFFLELNPAGQWGFVEDRTGQPITAALAALLARR
jgi:glutathione synthase/RimK-type ligase-like ATP-grasp enzyme